MPSIIPGYNYDIFISYRQKDNKYDGWVTEFVDNLNRELESAFKEEISVYFDINPSDYLLETYDVGASLKDKLKCLVFIPIISRTYCDPRSFAWENEFKAFVDLASEDKFGLKVALPNGNITSRLLPVRINDLDPEDLRLCESVSGGVFRGIDFVYKEPGVNRPLRSKEENPHDNLNHTFYRNQINKVALAVREIIESLKAIDSGDEAGGKEIKGKKSGEKQEQKPVFTESEITSSPEESLIPDNNISSKEKKKSKAGGKSIFVPVLLAAIAIIMAAVFLLHNRSMKRWARKEAIPEIEEAYNKLETVEAFKLLNKAKKYIPEDSLLKIWESRIVNKVTILTDPPGADVFIRDYSDYEGDWKKIGTTPVDSMSMPTFTFYQAILVKDGYDTVLAVLFTGIDTLSRKLTDPGIIPHGMVYVDGYWDEVKNTFEKKYGFFMDKYEVTNRQYKEFVDKGGYRNRDYWKNTFSKDGLTLTWEDAMAVFSDKTGRPGPSTWEAGDYPEGQDDYPVTGVSWYEAAAYAEFAGKELPTGDHWDSGAGFFWNSYYETIGPKIYPLSNFNGKNPEPIGSNRAITTFGIYDMAGNVREWCWNETSTGRIICGGGWSDATYLFTTWNQLPPFDRSPENGFRCVQYIDKNKIPETAFRLIDLGSGSRDFSLETPVSDEVFKIYKNQFLYDKKALDARTEERDETPNDWIVEKISFNAAYDDRIVLYLYLPKNASPPFQTLIFFPGSYAVESQYFNNGSNGIRFLDYVLKSGRAIAYPVYFRTFERNDGTRSHGANQSHQYTEFLIKLVKDFSRSVDYLETRDDIDANKLGYYGHSWGGILGGIIPAVEDRLKANILVVGGFWGWAYPEADAVNYVSRVTIPTLMLNGEYDYRFPPETNLKPFYNMLGTPDKDKRLLIYKTGHYVSKNNLIKEVLDWCDKYLGPVRYLKDK